MDVYIDCMCEYLFLFVLCQNVMYYCAALSSVFDLICALKVFIIIIIIIIINGRLKNQVRARTLGARLHKDQVRT